MTKLEFQGRGPVYSHHLGVPYRTLEVDAKKSMPPKDGKPDLNDNLIIHGDNLQALKALMPVYEGKVKCIYIDPPYNTGNEGWAYNDKVNSPLMQEWLGKVVDGDDQCRHDKWLCMMWPRLNLLKDLLADDGVIFISIDDNEQHRLRVIMDEIFGEENFITNIIWQKKYAPANDAKYFSDNHDFIVCYAKSTDKIDGWPRKLMPRTQKQDKLYKNDDNDGRGPWRTDNLSAKAYSEDYDYPLINPKTGKEHSPPRGAGWRTSRKTMEKWIKENRVFFGKDGQGKPQLKRYLNEVQQGVVPLTIWTYEEVGHTDSARKVLKDIFSDKQLPFDNPKAVGLVDRIIQVAADKNAIILDSFAGSGTTAHAVLALNKEDGGNRKFILVQCNEWDRQKKKEVNICDTITAERTRRVIKGVPEAKDENLKTGLGGSFTYATLGAPIDADMMLTGESLPPYEQLARHVFWTATGETLEGAFKERDDGFIGESAKYRLHLIYKPDLDFLGGPDAALTLDKVEALRKKATGKKRLLVFAPVSYMDQEDLSEHRVTFCQLPWAINQKVE